MNLSLILEKLDIDIKDILNVCIYGSRVYGTYTDDSDYHLLIILNDDVLCITDQITIDNCDITIISLQQIKIELFSNNIQRFELLWSTCNPIHKINLLDFFILDLQMLRISVATISTKCLAYAKILWLKENDIKKSKKIYFILFVMYVSEFKSLRIQLSQIIQKQIIIYIKY